MKLLWLTNLPSPYRVAFYSELGKHCDLTVVFERAGSAERDKSWQQYTFEHFNGIVLNSLSISVDKSLAFGVGKYIDTSYDYVVVSNFLTPTGMLAIQKLRRKKIPYYLESDGGFYHPTNPLLAALKTHFIKGAAGYFSTGDAHDEYYTAFGADKEKLIRYPFSSVRADEILPAVPTAEEKRELRKTLGMDPERPTLVTVGQFIPRKGFDVLLKALGQTDPAIAAYVIGGKPTEEYEALVQEHGLKQVHFVDFLSRQEIGNYFKAADFFVLPTRYDIWGLVINEAMAYGLPVITTDRCLAGLTLVEDGVGGYIVPTEQVAPLSEKIARLAADEALRHTMAQRNLDTITHHTIESMAARYLEVFKHTERLR